MTWPDQMLELIDRRVRSLSLASAGAAGTVQVVAPDRLSAQVVVDGATVGVPVKVAGHVSLVAGDRVALLRIGERRLPGENYVGEEWCVVGVTSRVDGLNIAVANFSLTAGTNTSASIVDLPGTPTVLFTKRMDATPLLMYLSFTISRTVANAAVGAYLIFTQGALFTQIKIAEIESAVGSARFGPCHFRVAPDVGGAPLLGSGTWEVKAQWARASGAGQLDAFAGKDHGSIAVIELGT